MPGYTLYRKLFAQLLLLCVCLAAANTCPNKKLITAETHTAAVQRVDGEAETVHAICSEGFSAVNIHETFINGGGGAASFAAMMVFSLNLLDNVPGNAFYPPPKTRSALKYDSCPLFLKNETLIV